MGKTFFILPAAIAIICIRAGMALAAANPDTGPGCGPGKMLWAEWREQKNIAPQVMMATTNVSGGFGFAISSGTSGCTNDGVIMAEQKITVFASLNFENLSQEMAQGRGEHLASLATLLGIPQEHHPEFFAMTQEKYNTLVKSGEPTPAALLTALHGAIATHPVLAKVTASR